MATAVNKRRHRQTTVPQGLGVLRLPVSDMLRSGGVLSPYFQRPRLQKIGTGRNTKLFLKFMATKALVGRITDLQSGNRLTTFEVQFFDNTGPLENYSFDVMYDDTLTQASFVAAVQTAVLARATAQSYSMTAADIIYSVPNLLDKSLVPQARSFANPARSLNSAFQISATRDAMAFYSVSIPCALSLTGGENGAVVLEYADDSGISTNVVTVGTVRNGNTGTLTIGLNTLQTYGCQVSGVIPAGKYVRLRPVDTTGSPVQAFVGSQEVLI